MTAPGRLFTAGFAYDGDDRLDITRATGTGDALVLAPSWSLVQGVLTQRRDQRATHEAWLAYVEAYTLELAEQYAADRGPVERLVALGTSHGLTLVCRCRPGIPCHRIRAAHALEGWSRGALTYEGERDP